MSSTTTQRIYLDNAATSWPKAPGVSEASSSYIETNGSNLGRGSYSSAIKAGEQVISARGRLAKMFGLSDPKNCIFTSSATASLNWAILGLFEGGAFQVGGKVLATSLLHNAAARPLRQLEKKGLRVTYLPLSQEGFTDLQALKKAVTPKTKALVVNHASNVNGAVEPLDEIAQICRERGIMLIVDAAQSAGHVAINVDGLGIDALCVAPHKGLLAPDGLGLMLLSDRIADAMQPIMTGGTGSVSDSLDPPSFLPDRFEPGSPNVPAIVGLNRALDYIESEEFKRASANADQLVEAFTEGLSELIKGGLVKVIRPSRAVSTVPVVSIQTPGMDEAEVSGVLDSQFGIETRVGLHCAPIAHRALGTYPRGTIRFSFGPFNTPEQVTVAVNALKRVLK